MMGEQFQQKKQMQQFVDLKNCKMVGLEQQGFKASQATKTNWVYAFNFPFNIADKKHFISKSV